MVLLGEQIKGRKNVKKDSPYPQSDIVKYKDFQRAENKVDSTWLQFMNEKDKAKKKNLVVEYLNARMELDKETEKLCPPKDKILDGGL